MRSGLPLRTHDAGPDPDSYGFDERDTSRVSRLLRSLVPQWIARRALSVTVSTDRSTYEVGEPVEITVAVTNRFPLPVSVVTSGLRIWGWTVDGELEASDERRYESDRPNSLDFRGFQTKRFECTWDGRFKRTGSPTRWIEADPGEHEIGAFVETSRGKVQDSTTITLR